MTTPAGARRACNRSGRGKLITGVDDKARVRDAGNSEALGVVLIFPAILAFAILIIFLGRQVDTVSEVQNAAEAGAQAAARQRTPTAGIAAAEATVKVMLADDVDCAGGADVALNAAGAWAPGSQVTVTVTCTPRTDDLALIPAPKRTLHGASTALIDTYRAGALP